MYTDNIYYQLATGVTEEKLLQVAERIKEEWMNKLPGFIAWEIHKIEGGDYVDLVVWKDKASAENATLEMKNVPNGKEWFDLYEPSSIKAQKHILIKKV